VSETHLVADISGYFTTHKPRNVRAVQQPRAVAGHGHPKRARRQRSRTGAIRTIKVAGVGGVPATGSAVVINITVADPTATDTSRRYPAGILAAQHVGDQLLIRGDPLRIRAIVPVGQDGRSASTRPQHSAHHRRERLLHRRLRDSNRLVLRRHHTDARAGFPYDHAAGWSSSPGSTDILALTVDGQRPGRRPVRSRR